MFNAELYELTQSLYGALAAGMRQLRAQGPPEPLPDLYRLRAGRAESPGWFMVQAVEFDPEPLTVENLRVRDIYAAESLVRAILEIMASEKWLQRQGTSYALSAQGRGWYDKLSQVTGRRLSALEPLPGEQMARLEDLMARLIAASLTSPEPPGTWCLAHSRRRAPAQDAKAVVKIYQYTADFNAFRDDAHMAAWQPLGLDGRSWEAFSFVVKNEANSAAALFDQLAYRGYAEEDYAAALSDLADRGWLSAAGAEFQVTAAGQAVAEEVERLTDEYFFAPWRSLHAGEIEELIGLMTACIAAY